MIKKSLLILASLFILLPCANNITSSNNNGDEVWHPLTEEEKYGIDVSLPYEELKQEIKEKLKAYFEETGSYRIILTGTPKEYIFSLSDDYADTVGVALKNALAEMDIKNITIDVDLRYINFINGTLPEYMFNAYDPEKNDYFSVFYNIIFPENKITAIKESAFQCNCAIKEIVIPDSVTKIGTIAFADCGMLEKITLGKGIKRLGKYNTFWICDILKEIDTSRCSSLEYIGKSALDIVRVITEFAIPASVKEIDRYAFYDCPNLTTIIYYGDSPNNIKFLDKDIFYNCPELKNLIVPNAINPDDSNWDTFGNANFTYVGREKQ